MSSIMVPARAGDERAKTVASAIFGDGCAAAVLAGGRGASGPRVLATSVHQIPGSLHAVTLTSGPQDSYLHLARDLPEIAAENLAALVDDFMHANGLDREQVDHWMLHPGGRRIIERARDALGLDDEDVAISWRALAAHGNIGTPSIFHVLHSTLEQRRPRAGEHALAVTIGPGVSVGLMLLAF
jgi:alkylresorcinol/alkylpyrone synthase